MAKKDNWFKFDPSLWLLGRISDETPTIQAAYLTICCQFWVKKGKLSRKNLKKLPKKRIEFFISENYLLETNGFLIVPFLQEQLEENEAYRAQQREYGRQGAEKRHKGTPTQPQPNPKATSSPRARKNENKNNENGELRIENKNTDLNLSFVTKNNLGSVWLQELMKSENIQDSEIAGALYEFKNYHADKTWPNLQDLRSHFQRWFTKTRAPFIRNLDTYNPRRMPSPQND